MPRRSYSHSNAQEDRVFTALKVLAGMAVFYVFVPAARIYLLAFMVFLLLMLGIFVFLKLKTNAHKETTADTTRPTQLTSERITLLAGKKVTVPPAAINAVLIHSVVIAKLSEIDWYQFEKFCAALLQAQGWTVERKGGAQPDGGVDLIATKGDVVKLIQCKHWKTWNVQERVVRELLGSMAHYKVTQGAIYTFKGATRPAKEFAKQDGVEILDATELASQALGYMEQSLLLEILDNKTHHCPKCEAPMIFRTGNFEPFWGCRAYPRCRGVIKGG